MNLLNDVVTYIRRIIKSPSDAQISDNLIIDYINRFWIIDVDARLQLFDLKTKYQFMTTPGIDQYNMPLYNVQTQPGNQTIAPIPLYQGFIGPARINGITTNFYTQRSQFLNLWPNYLQQLPNAAVGDGGASYTIQLPYFPAVPGHIDVTGIIAANNSPIDDPLFVTNFNTSIPVSSVNAAVFFTATGEDGQNITVTDSGQFLQGSNNSQLYGLLMAPGAAPFGNQSLGSYSTTQNTVNYTTGVANITFPVNIPAGSMINASCYFYQQGIPRSVLFYNNTLTLRSPPNTQYLVELDAYLTPAAFLNTGDALPFGYMSEYIARGAARKILSDTGDTEQFMFYEPLFREQEMLVWKRSQRQWTATRTETIYSTGTGQGASGNGLFGAGIT